MQLLWRCDTVVTALKAIGSDMAKASGQTMLRMTRARRGVLMYCAFIG